MLSWCFCLNTKYGKLAVRHGHFILQQDTAPLSCSGVSRNFLIWGEGGIRFNYSHWNFKTCVNVPYVNKTVTDFFFAGGIYTDIPPVATPVCQRALHARWFVSHLYWGWSCLVATEHAEWMHESRIPGCARWSISSEFTRQKSAGRTIWLMCGPERNRALLG